MPLPSVSFVSLGCPKNLVDSEKMLGLLAEAGCPIVSSDVGRADVLVINTCGFLAASRDEALEIIRDAARRKRRGQYQRIVVAGCLVQRDGLRLLEEVPEIDALVGVHHRADLLQAVLSVASPPPVASAPRGRRKTGTTSPRKTDTDPQDAGANAGGSPVPLLASSAPRKTDADAVARARIPSRTPPLFLGDYHPASWTGSNRSDQARLRLTPRHYAYLRISEGCDQKCTFCTIPSIRGPMHSKTPDEILAEARELIDDGAVELLLIGQDTTGYGRDLGYAPGLPGLLREMNRLDGLEWLRLMYVYPTDVADDLIAAVAECDRVVKYIDIPLQHVNDRILRAMHRRVTRGETETLLEKLRRSIPGVAIRTTFIAGFPGETEAECEELRRFIVDFGFDAVGVFAYSNEPGTPAFRMKDQLPPDLIKTRVEMLMLAQQEIAFRRAASRKGETFRVLIDDLARDRVFPARHQGQAPEVDSLVLVKGGHFDPGQFVSVRITGARGYDLLARPTTHSLPQLRS